MTVNLLQLDHHGKESITPMFMSDEDKATMQWLYSLEAAASGTTIFVHRLSSPGHYFCTVPCTHQRLAGDPSQPVRYCGCFTCIDQRDYLRNYTARAIIMDMTKLIPVSLMQEVMKEQDDLLDC